MTREEAEEFWASEDDARKDYPGAIRSFVGTVQSLAATEKERDELRATVDRVEALANNPEGDCYGAPCIWPSDLLAALHPEEGS